MVAPGVMEASIAANQVYSQAVRRLPKEVVYCGIAMGGLLGVAVVMQTQGVRNIHPYLDVEPPLCKKVHCFVRYPDGSKVHRRMQGYTTMSQAVQELAEDKASAQLRLQADAYTLDDMAPLHSLCKPVDSKSDAIPCTVHLDLLYEAAKKA
eukprot:TRINITY_DN3905_c3_g1_i1.p3 TRINITY_DN3905_c3_g1~~TRINITY_DN3905_c3_g1_i1.p3  ORF type:complete len:151 (+),score=53.39 TRINITY_DN3905_c3_g1_i1:51-503(+)